MSFSWVPAAVEGVPVVGGFEVNGYSGWVVGMFASGCDDVVGWDRSGWESGGGGGGGDDDGGGGDDGGSGDVVGEWSGVMGLSEVGCKLTSDSGSISGGLVVGKSVWGWGLMCSMVDCTWPIMSPSWLDRVKVDVRCAITWGFVLLSV